MRSHAPAVVFKKVFVIFKLTVRIFYGGYGGQRVLSYQPAFGTSDDRSDDSIKISGHCGVLLNAGLFRRCVHYPVTAFAAQVTTEWRAGTHRSVNMRTPSDSLIYS